MKKIILFSLGFLFLLSIFLYFGDIIKIDKGPLVKNELPQYFKDTDIYPKIKGNLNEQFTIHVGQVASFKEGFSIMLVGYESMCGGGSFEYLEDLIIKRAEASQCSPETSVPVYVFIKDGKILGDIETYTFDYGIYTVSDQFERVGYFNVIVKPVDKNEIDYRKEAISNHAL